MRKNIVWGINEWTERLLTIYMLKEIDYFVDNKVKKNEEKYWYGKKVYSPNILNSEKKGEVVIIIANSKEYETADIQLKDMGFRRDIDYFNGWKLSEEYFSIEQKITWDEFENDEPTVFERDSFRERMEHMIKMLPSDVKKIIDVGCGNQRLRTLIDPKIEYVGIDKKKKYPNTIECDLNKEGFPKVFADCVYMAGILEYIHDINQFFSGINSKYILFSYIGLENLTNYGTYQNKGILPCSISRSLSWDVLQCAINRGYSLVKVDGRMNEIYYLMVKQNMQ